MYKEAGGIYDEDYRSRSEAKASIFEYIEVFYNRQRRHSHLGLVAPLAFEKASASRQLMVRETGEGSL